SEHDGQEQDAVGVPIGGGGAADPAQGGCDGGIAAGDSGHPRVPDAVVVARAVRVDGRNQADDRDRGAEDGEDDPARLLHRDLRWAACYFSPSTLPLARRRIASFRRLSFVSSRLADSIQAKYRRR